MSRSPVLSVPNRDFAAPARPRHLAHETGPAGYAPDRPAFRPSNALPRQRIAPMVSTTQKGATLQLKSAFREREVVANTVDKCLPLIIQLTPGPKSSVQVLLSAIRSLRHWPDN